MASMIHALISRTHVYEIDFFLSNLKYLESPQDSRRQSLP